MDSTRPKFELNFPFDVRMLNLKSCKIYSILDLSAMNFLMWFLVRRVVSLCENSKALKQKFETKYNIKCTYICLGVGLLLRENVDSFQCLFNDWLKRTNAKCNLVRVFGRGSGGQYSYTISYLCKCNVHTTYYLIIKYLWWILVVLLQCIGRKDRKRAAC